jgi:hypothetical protein
MELCAVVVTSVVTTTYSFWRSGWENYFMRETPSTVND